MSDEAWGKPPSWSLFALATLSHGDFNDLNITACILCGPPISISSTTCVGQLKQIPPRLPRRVHRLHCHPSYTSNVTASGHNGHRWFQHISTLWKDKAALFVTWLWRLGIIFTGQTAKILKSTHPFSNGKRKKRKHRKERTSLLRSSHCYKLIWGNEKEHPIPARPYISHHFTINTLDNFQFSHKLHWKNLCYKKDSTWFTTLNECCNWAPPG